MNSSSHIRAGTLPLRGDVVAGRYRVESVLGEGGFGIVYAARHEHHGELVALKLLTHAADDAHRRRFEREARLTARLRHPNTVRVLDSGETDDGVPFFAMEFLQGRTLEQQLQDGPLAEETAVDIVAQVLKSLAEAHAAGLVHRDLKPANLMLCDLPDGGLHVKVLDFGIAVSVRPENALTSAGLGTPAYMSPEQCDAQPIDARSDLYAVGVILFRCLTGQLPFADEDPLALLRAHATKPPPDVRRLSPRPLKNATAETVMRALAKSPEERFASAQDMCLALTGQVQAVATPRTPQLRSIGAPTATSASASARAKSKVWTAALVTGACAGLAWLVAWNVPAPVSKPHAPAPMPVHAPALGQATETAARASAVSPAPEPTISPARGPAPQPESREAEPQAAKSPPRTATRAKRLKPSGATAAPAQPVQVVGVPPPQKAAATLAAPPTARRRISVD